MRKLAVILISTIVASSLNAQAPQVSFDHMALIVSDLEKSIDFYMKVLGFHKIEDPTGNPDIDWVANDKGQQLHFLQGDISLVKTTKSVHMSFSVVAMHPFITNLADLNIAYESWEGEKSRNSIRADGVRQIYLQDPDGYWIEINDRPNR